MLAIIRLSNGQYRIRGDGSGNCCDVSRWPASHNEIDDGLAAEATERFRQEVHAELDRALSEAAEIIESDIGVLGE